MMGPLKSVAFAAVFVVASTVAALAHAKMNASIPKDGETVPAGLSEIQLQFSKPLRLTLIHVRRVDDRQEIAVSSGLPKSFVDSAKVAVETLQVGSYEVFWTAVSNDGHVMKGSFAFSVKQSPDAQLGR
jgi:methionine-rich copper-binding protein CopC